MSKSENYMSHLNRVTSAVEQLDAGEQDIDKVLPLVQSGFESLKFLSDRIKAVEEGLAEMDSLFPQSR